MARRIVVDPFCYKQFDQNSGAVFIPYDLQLFENMLNQLYFPELLKPGYAPFCKHLFVENFTEAKVATLEITEQNKHHLQSDYESRTPKELPVLVRWFPASAFGEIPKARYLDIILYSYDQVQQENEAMGNTDPNKDLNYEWGVVGIKPQDEDFELPMNPITMLRNALGKDQGGSGVPLNREQYTESVNYWRSHALIREK